MEGNQEQAVTVASIQRFEAIRSAIGTAALAEMIVAASERIERRAAPQSIGSRPTPWPGSGRPIDPDALGQALNELLVEPVRTANGQVDVQWTVGMAARGTAGSDRRSMAAVSVARTEGRTSSWFTGAPSSAVRDLSMMGELRHGIDDGQLFVVYQPNSPQDRRHHPRRSARPLEASHRRHGPARPIPAPCRGNRRRPGSDTIRPGLRTADMAAQTSPLLHVSVNVSAADIGDLVRRAVIRMVSDQALIRRA